MESVLLPLITSLARAGALDRAWALFEAEGLHERYDDPAVLAVKGRLLKDRAIRADVEDRAAVLADAAQAYAAADALDPQPYLLINVATLSALRGDWDAAARTADTVLERLVRPVAETPYYIAATRAEACLLKGEGALAKAAMTEAIAASPDAWMDHASTLRQLGLILEAQGEEADWLDDFRPPRSLHFAGHLGIDPAQCAELRRDVDRILGDQHVGFGYGALAVGADIVIAEALLASGAELHVILPTSIDAFIAQSVRPYDPAWLPRFEACISAAASVREVTGVAGGFEPMATALAGELAMGAALLNASQLQSRALQLLVIDEGDGPFGDGVSTARDGDLWLEGGHAQHLLVAPRTAPVSPSRGKAEGRGDYGLKALLHIGFAGTDRMDEGAFAGALDTTIAPFWKNCGALSPAPDLVQAHGNARMLVFSSPEQAIDWAIQAQALAARQQWPLVLAGHYGLVHMTALGAIGPPVAALGALAEACLPGAVTVSESLAAALHLRSGADFRAELVGEAAGQRLFALVPNEAQ